MSTGKDVKIALVGAAGMSFGPVMVHDAIHSEKIKGAHLVMMDLNERALGDCFAAAERLNTYAGEPIRITMTTSIGEALDGADFVLTSVEKNRFPFWQQDYEIPVRHGSTQIMGENGGPGGLFHSLRTIHLILSICKDIEKYAPNSWLLNLTNPMSRVCLAVNRATKLKNVGLCHEITGGIGRIATNLLKPIDKINAEANGINHFQFFYKIEDKETGKDLYPALRRHVKMFPFMYPKLVRFMFDEYGYLATSTDSHIGEYVPFAKEVVGNHMVFNKFFEKEGALRNVLTTAYGKGWLPLPIHKLPRSFEFAFPIIEAIATGERDYIQAVNVPNKGYIPNLPEDSLVEVHAYVDANGIDPQPTPPVFEPIAEFMRTQIKLQDLIVESALKKDPKLAFEALVADPLSPPDESSCRKIFDQLYELQKEHLPF